MTDTFEEIEQGDIFAELEGSLVSILIMGLSGKRESYKGRLTNKGDWVSIELIGKLKRILVRKPLIVSIWEYKTPMTDKDRVIQALLRGNVVITETKEAV